MPSYLTTPASRLLERLLFKERYIFLHYQTDDAEAAAFAVRYMVEGQTYDLGKGRAVRFDRAHTPGGQDHIHCLQKGKSLYALNRDGTAHDASHGATMLRCYTDYIQQRFPDFNVPSTRVIEAMLAEGEQRARLLVEANESASRPTLLSRAVMWDAVLQAWLG